MSDTDVTQPGSDAGLSFAWLAICSPDTRSFSWPLGASMRTFRKWASGAFVLFIVSCGGLQSPQEYDRLGRRVLRITQAHDSIALKSLLEPELLNPTAQAQLR